MASFALRTRRAAADAVCAGIAVLLAGVATAGTSHAQSLEWQPRTAVTAAVETRAPRRSGSSEAEWHVRMSIKQPTAARSVALRERGAPQTLDTLVVAALSQDTSWQPRASLGAGSPAVALADANWQPRSSISQAETTVVSIRGPRTL